MHRFRLAALGGLLAVFVLASLVTRPRQSKREHDPLLVGAQIPDDVRAAIVRSCADCHSEATRYPWYSYVAPVSFLINSDVNGGREHLNFTRWAEYSSVRRQRALSDIANQTQDGEMPLGIYTLMHRDAKLSETDKSAIFQWTQAERARLIRGTQ